MVNQNFIARLALAGRIPLYIVLLGLMIWYQVATLLILAVLFGAVIIETLMLMLAAIYKIRKDIHTISQVSTDLETIRNNTKSLAGELRAIRKITETSLVAVDQEDLEQRREKLIRLFDEWLKDESGYEERTWPELKKYLDDLDDSRFSSQRLSDE